MGSPASSPTVPTLIVVRTTAAVLPRSLDSIDTGRRRGDRLVIARPLGSPAIAPRLSTGRRIDAEEIATVDVLALAAEHARVHGGPTVIVDGDAFGFGNRWIGDLTRSLDQHGLVVPVTNGAPWPNTPLDLPDARSTRTAWREFARALEGRQPEVVDASTVGTVAAPAVALAPATAIALADKIGRTNDLSARTLARAAARLDVTVARAHHVYVHQDVDVVLSACLIMKDEVENLERCLASLQPVVDEVVIYDTGSVDGSVELARSLGATVIEGYWDDDFARARNEARKACRGVWLLHVDCDEEIEHPQVAAPELRDALLRDLPYDIVIVPLYNLIGTELAPTRDPNAARVPRILHRTRCHWSGALHEQPLLVSSRSLPRALEKNLVTLLHYGYIDEVFHRRDKGERNTRIADTRLVELDDAGRAHFDRARTHLLNGRHVEGLAEYLKAAATADLPVYQRCAVEGAALCYLNMGDLANAEIWTEKRAAIAEKPGVARWLKAKLALARDDGAGALVLLDGITEYNDAFSSNGEESIHMLRAQAYLLLEDLDAMGREALAALAANPAHDAAWVAVITLAEQQPDLLQQAAALVPDDQLKLLAGKLLSVPPAAAGLMAEALWADRPGSATVLAFGAGLAPSLDLEAAATWAVRLRSAGHAELCPLRAVAADADADVVRRLQAAYLGAELFDDALLRAAVEDLSAALPAG